MSRKVFTAGEVLAAADVNSFLMDQTVMSFASSAARGSAIPSPTLGMYTHLEDAPQRTEFWNGSAWQTPMGATLTASVSFTSTTSVIIANCFNANFTNYLITIDKASGGSSTQFQLRAGATTLATGYAGLVLFGTVGGASVSARSSTTFESFAASADFTTAYISAPFLARTKRWLCFAQQGSLPGIDAGTNSSTTSHESAVLSFGSNCTGVIRIYGLRDS
jgi:hypothetical protein